MMMDVLQVSGDAEIAEVGVLRFRGDDRYCVETVDGLAPPLPRREKWIINVSTQFGCPVGCPFCDAALDYYGDLTVDELLAQVRWVLGRHPGMAQRCAKLKVHFARIGEPAFNDAVIEALERLPEVVASPGLWACVATTAPTGCDRWFDDLRAVKERLYRGRFQLQFSVQSTDPKDRARLTPIPHWPLERIAEYGAWFWQPGDRKVVLNFALAWGVAFDPQLLAAMFDPERFAVKITPVNPTARGAQAGFATVLRSERAAAVESARDLLVERGFEVILSVGAVEEDWIGSNCGQVVRVARPAMAEPRPATAVAGPGQIPSCGP